MPTPRKPLERHQLQGSKPDYTPETPIASGRPKFPRGISGEARRTFKRLVAMLEERRHLTNADGELLSVYCHAYDRHQRALAKLAEEGEVRVYVRLDSNGQPHEQEKVNLWLKIAETSERTMIACLDRLGLSPLNRSKVKHTEPEKKKELVPGSMAWMEAQDALQQQAKVPETDETELLASIDENELEIQ